MIPNFVFYLIIFIFGLAVGSFLNCLIYRLEKEESFLRGHSYCPRCHHQLNWQDLIPVLSFLILRGKCRYCGKPISYQYPLVEIATGLLFVLILNFEFQISNQFLILNFQNLITTLYLLLTACFLIIIFVFDLKHFIIPDKVIIPAILIVLLYHIPEFFSIKNSNFIQNSKFEILNFLLAAFGAAIFFLIIFLISRGRWLGFGDVKLAFLIGFLLGSPNILVGLFFAFLIGAIIGVGLILAKRKSFKSEVPFGPFLVTGTFIALFWGEKIIQWYLNLFICQNV